MYKEISMGLPRGVSMGDLFQHQQQEGILKQAHLLAVQANNIEEYLNRFDSAHVPESCKSVVEAQITKLRAVQGVIWNTMISMASGSLSIDDETLKTLIEKQADDSLALMEMEKLATVIKMDESTNWAVDIGASLLGSGQASNVIYDDVALQQLGGGTMPLYDDPEELEEAQCVDSRGTQRTFEPGLLKSDLTKPIEKQPEPLYVNLTTDGGNLVVS